jgi:nicotinamidase-related amidase
VPIALLLIDVLTTFQFPDGEAILKHALRMRSALVTLKARAREAGIPVLYVNDNFGDWRSEKEVLMGRCLEAKGAEFVRPLLPDSEDYFVLKPMHSAFYMTPLEVLLQHLRTKRARAHSGAVSVKGNGWSAYPSFDFAETDRPHS